jgi:hypothetical protein
MNHAAEKVFAVNVLHTIEKMVNCLHVILIPEMKELTIDP